jgi:Ca2+-transporting ATPase
VAREASSLVLLQDDFASIVATIRLGRRIYDNLRKAIEYVVAVHVPIAGMALLPLFFGLPLMLMPIQIALLEMVIDPACSIIFEAEKEEPDVMRRPPRPPGAPILPQTKAVWALLQGLVALAITSGTLLMGAQLRIPEETLRATVFSVLVLVNIGLILVNRSFHGAFWAALLRPNRPLWVLVAVVIVVLGAAVYWPPAQDLFHFRRLDLSQIAFALLAGGLTVVSLQLLKELQFKSASMRPKRTIWSRLRDNAFGVTDGSLPEP